MKKHKMTMATVASLATLAIASPAAAEGSWSSSITDALTGFNSRTWADNNNDANATKITFKNCTHNWGSATPKSAEVQLTRQTPWYQPDDNRGRKTLNCGTSATGDWGRQSSGSFHFTITKIGGMSSGPRLSVQTVSVSY